MYANRSWTGKQCNLTEFRWLRFELFFPHHLKTSVTALSERTRSSTLRQIPVWWLISCLRAQIASSCLATSSSRYWYRSFFRARHSLADCLLLSNFAFESILAADGCEDDAVGWFLVLRNRFDSRAARLLMPLAADSLDADVAGGCWSSTERRPGTKTLIV